MARTTSAARKPRARRAQSPARAIVVHSLDHAVAALREAAKRRVAVELWSAEGAAAYGGAGWFKALADEARAEVRGARATFVLDCASLPGYALAAFRARVDGVCFTGPARVAGKLADIARRSKCRLLRKRPARALDLRAVEDPGAACRLWLARTRGR